MREGYSHHLLGVRLDALTFADLQRIIEESVELDERCLIANHNLHSVYLFHHDAKMRAFYGCARYVYVDGMPLVWIGRLLGHPLRRKHRPTCIEYLRPLLTEAARRGWRVFYLGSRPEVAERGLYMFKKELPGLKMATAHGYFHAEPSGEENQEILKRIEAYQPNILMVGMGMPRQEHWILENLERIQANVIINVGACLDFLAGEKSTAPRWLGQIGLEWVYRLVSEPRRLWRRYLLEPWFITGLILREGAERIRLLKRSSR